MDPDTDGIKVLDIDYVDTYKAMEKLVESGKTKSIGKCSSSFSLHSTLSDG